MKNHKSACDLFCKFSAADHQYLGVVQVSFFPELERGIGDVAEDDNNGSLCGIDVDLLEYRIDSRKMTVGSSNLDIELSDDIPFVDLMALAAEHFILCRSQLPAGGRAERDKM